MDPQNKMNILSKDLLHAKPNQPNKKQIQQKYKTLYTNLVLKREKENFAKARVEEGDHGIDTSEAEPPKSSSKLDHHQQQEHAFLQETGQWDHSSCYDSPPRSLSGKKGQR